MELFNRFKRFLVEPVIEEKDEGIAICNALKSTGLASWTHVCALRDLFLLELKDSAGRLGKKAALLAAALLALFFFYSFLWCLIIAIIAHFWNIIAALSIAALVHLVALIIFAVRFMNTPVAPIAPSTVEELKTDLACLQMALKKNTNS